MAVFQIPGTKSYISTFTGRTYATEKRAQAAERRAIEMSRTGGFEKTLRWKDAPKEIRTHERKGSNTFVDTMNLVGWDPISIIALLDNYDEYAKEEDGSPAWVLDTILKDSGYTAVYVEKKDGSTEWGIRKEFDIDDVEKPDLVVSGSEKGLKAGG